MEINKKNVAKMKRMLLVLKAVKFKDFVQECERKECIKQAEDFIKKYEELKKNGGKND